MSELKANKITSKNSNSKLTIGTGLEIVSGDNLNDVKFQTTDYGDIKVLGALALGSQTGSTTGNLNQIVYHGGSGNSPRWGDYIYRCPVLDSAAPTDTVYTYIIDGYYEGCTGNTVDFPSPPEGFLYCNGLNETPDFRKQNFITGQLSFEGSCKGTLSGSLPYQKPSTSTTWTVAYIIKT
jgi:hypothetical protein